MTNEEIQKKQKETLEALNKFNNERKTKIVEEDEEEDEPVEKILEAFERGEKGVTKPPMEKWLEVQENSQPQDIPETPTLFIEKPNPDSEGSEEKLIMSHICPYCGTMAYIGQIHGLGYCKEKLQYEQ